LTVDNSTKHAHADEPDGSCPFFDAKKPKNALGINISARSPFQIIDLIACYMDNNYKALSPFFHSVSQEHKKLRCSRC